MRGSGVGRRDLDSGGEADFVGRGGDGWDFKMGLGRGEVGHVGEVVEAWDGGRAWLLLLFVG